ncbi:MAG TPA: hypothetical protein VM491_20095 [Burkholderiaceae bacterium]|nr:hypothetical protein [Burkholderiaceae bacterium]
MRLTNSQVWQQADPSIFVLHALFMPRATIYAGPNGSHLMAIEGVSMLVPVLRAR